MACETVVTSRTEKPGGILPGPLGDAGTTAWVKPSRATSWILRLISGTGRTSPASPISPKHTSRWGSGRSWAADASAMHTARSVAGSVSRTPPTVDT